MLAYIHMQKYRTTVNLPKHLYRQAKLKALDENKTFTQILEEGLRLLFEKREVKIAKSLSDFLSQPISQVDTASLEKLQSMTDAEIQDVYKQKKANKYK